MTYYLSMDSIGGNDRRHQVREHARIEETNAKVPVCRGCGESFMTRGEAEQAHGRMGCGTETGQRGYQMTKHSEAF